MDTGMDMNTGHGHYACKSPIVLVTDKEMRVCVDPGGNGATMNERGEGGPGPPGRGEDKQLVSNSGDR